MLVDLHRFYSLKPHGKIESCQFPKFSRVAAQPVTEMCKSQLWHLYLMDKYCVCYAIALTLLPFSLKEIKADHKFVPNSKRWSSWQARPGHVLLQAKDFLPCQTASSRLVRQCRPINAPAVPSRSSTLPRPGFSNVLSRRRLALLSDANISFPVERHEFDDWSLFVSRCLLPCMKRTFPPYFFLIHFW